MIILVAFGLQDDLTWHQVYILAETSMLSTIHELLYKHDLGKVELLFKSVQPRAVEEYNMGITTLGRSRQSEHALALLRNMREAGLTADVISFGAAISACEKGGQWEQALVLLRGMRKADMAANVISLSAAISACEKGWQWEQVLALLREIRETHLTANVVSLNAAIPACE